MTSLHPRRLLDLFLSFFDPASGNVQGLLVEVSGAGMVVESLGKIQCERGREVCGVLKTGSTT